MKYTITKMDGRHSHVDWFEYYIGFNGQMSSHQGPVHFNHALKWFIDTYGWSAEIRQYDKIMRWAGNSLVNTLIYQAQNQGALPQRPEHCNPMWSWSNHFDNLRIYVATDRELAFFTLTNARD